MRWLAALVVVAACGGDAPSTLTIQAKPPAVGQISVVELEQHSTETLTIQGTDLAITKDHTERRRAEVLEVSAIAATKLRVTYEAREEQETADGQTRDTTAPVVGKTYVVWRDGADVRATADGGGAISDEERAALADDHLDLGTVAQMEAMVTSRTWKRGEKVHFDAEELRELDHAHGATAAGTQTTAATLTWTGTSGGVATFTTVMQIETDNAAVALSTTMTGTVKVEIAHARPVEITINVSGRGVVLGGRAAGAGLQITNRGTQRYVYLAPHR